MKFGVSYLMMDSHEEEVASFSSSKHLIKLLK